MAELLILNRDATPEQRSYKRGDVVVVREDGHEWGRAEGLPDFVVAHLPGVSVSLAAAALVQALVAAGLTVGSDMSGNAAAQPVVAGTVTLRVGLDAAVVVQAIAAGSLSADGLIVAGTPGYRVTRAPRTWTVTRAPRTWTVTRAPRTWRVAA